MPMNEQDVIKAALALPSVSRAMIIGILEDSLNHETDEIDAGAIEKAWMDEAEARLAAFERGDVSAVPGETMPGRLRARASE